MTSSNAENPRTSRAVRRRLAHAVVPCAVALASTGCHADRPRPTNDPWMEGWHSFSVGVSESRDDSWELRYQLGDPMRVQLRHWGPVLDADDAYDRSHARRATLRDFRFVAKPWGTFEEGGAYLLRDDSSPPSPIHRGEGILRWTRDAGGWWRVSLSPKLDGPAQILVYEQHGLGPG